MADRVVKVPAAPIVNKVCRQLKFSRSHVANMLRKYRSRLGARKDGARWVMWEDKVQELKDLVREESGPRYKSGRRGENRQ